MLEISQETWAERLNNHAEPDYWFVRIAWADWLEEQGRDQEAQGWRRLVKEKRRPYRRGTKPGEYLGSMVQEVYVWLRRDNNAGNKEKAAPCGWLDEARHLKRFSRKQVLPAELFYRIMNEPNSEKYHLSGAGGQGFLSLLAAEKALVRAYLREETQ
jgi:hypothetical protein